MDSTKFRKQFTNDDLSPTNINVFVPGKSASRNVPGKGMEFDLEVLSDEQLINKIFETNTYNHNYESLVEFYSDIYYIMNAREVKDKRNVGTVTGIAAFSIAGIFTCGLGCMAGIVGVVIGSTVGRCFGKNLGNKKKQAKVTQEDLYLSKLKALIKLGYIQKKKYRNNVNKLRLIMEKIIEESAPALETELFEHKKEVTQLLNRLRKLLLNPTVHKTILLSYKLFKAFPDHFDTSDRKHFNDTAKRVNQIFTPYVRLMELDNKIETSVQSNPNLIAYQRIKELLSAAEIKEAYAPLQVKNNPEALEKLKSFLRQEVDVRAPIMKAMTRTNQQETENINLDTSPRAQEKKKPMMIPDEVVADERLPSDDPNFLRASGPSYGDLQEDPTPRPGSVYAFGSPTRKEFNVNGQDSPVSGDNNNNNMISPQKVIIPRLLESVESESVTESDHWVMPVKVLHEHSDAENMSENAQREVQAQREAIARLSSQVFSRSPTKKLSRAAQYEEEEKEGFADSPTGKQSSPQKRGNKLLTALAATPRRLKSGFTSVLKKQKTGTFSDQAGRESVGSESKKEESGVIDESDLLKQSTQMDGTTEAMFQRILSIGSDVTSKWERVVTNPLIKIDKIRPEGSPVVLIRAWAFIEGFSPQEVFDQIYDTEKRAKWETVTMSLSVVEKIDETSQVIYFYVKTPIGISERDFVQVRNFKLDYPQKDHIVMSFKSVNHPKMPPMKGRIRAETHIAGYIMKPSTQAPNSTDFCIVSQSDIKGNIPKVIVNMASGKAPAEWINKLIKACEKSRKQNA